MQYIDTPDFASCLAQDENKYKFGNLSHVIEIKIKTHVEVKWNHILIYVYNKQ